MTLRSPEIAAAVKPGQFVNISPPVDSLILRRPLGVYRKHGDKITILFKVIGRGTGSMAKMQKGDELDIIGPLGNGFDLDAKQPETIILVAGGFGIVPLHSLAEELCKQKKTVYLFVGTEEGLPLEMSDSALEASFIDPKVKATINDFEELGVIARVASLTKKAGYFHGLVTDMLEKLLEHQPLGPAKIYACGPWAMLRKTAAIADDRVIPCDALLEERMGCGIGACMSCAVRVKTNGGTYARACVEGPVFDATIVDWEAK